MRALNDGDLDRLVTDAGRLMFDTLIAWRPNRLGRNLERLITLLEELHAVGWPSCPSTKAST